MARETPSGSSSLTYHLEDIFADLKVQLQLQDDDRAKIDRLPGSKPLLHLLDEAARLVKTKQNLDEASTRVDAALDFIWEKLNTGYWKDVEMGWRIAYSHASLLRTMTTCVNAIVVELESIRKALEACDRGLLMGAPIQDDLLTKVASRLNAFIRASETSESKRYRLDEGDRNAEPASIGYQGKGSTLERIRVPSLHSFQTRYMNREQPIIVEGAMTHWPALRPAPNDRRWTLDYIKRVAGSRTVPVELGARYTDETWGQSLITMNEFIDKYVAGGESVEKGYLAQHRLFDQIPELKRDICIPDYCCISSSDDDVDVNAWFGPQGTVSPLHYDPKRNLLAQVVGSKYVRLYEKSQTDFLYAHRSDMLKNTSQVDVECVDVAEHPLFCDAVYWDGVLKEGEMLYIPPMCWHFVKSLSVSFSVSFWWE